MLSLVIVEWSSIQCREMIQAYCSFERFSKECTGGVDVGFKLKIGVVGLFK